MFYGKGMFAFIALCSFLFLSGPVAPIEAVGIAYTSTAYTTATLQWNVPYITYTAETYTVIFGTDSSDLDQSSPSITGNSDITTEDQIFSFQLTGLIHDTTYFYQIVATNSYASNASMMSSFVTFPLRK